jgi:nicotinamidase-related amidase
MASSTPKQTAARAATPLAQERARHGTALLIVDMISEWSFPDAPRALAQALRIAAPIAALRARCRKAGIPVIYANDNQGRWRSDFRDLVERAAAAGGRRIVELLEPDADDYFVLKPKHSAFFGTPLDMLLRHLQAQRLVLTGVSSDQCLLATAAEARMRDYDVVAPRDCMASLTAARHARAVQHFEDVLTVRTTPSPQLRWARAR